MKNIEKEKAINLRKQGKSIRNIAKILGVSKGSISLWVKDVVLTQEQKEKLKSNNPIFSNYGNIIKSKMCRDKRRKYQDQGKQIAKNKYPLHIMGCMLYWAEGNRKNNKNVVDFVNCDIDLIKVFIQFLKKYYNVDNSDINIKIKYYDNNGLSKENIISYWDNVLKLNIDESNLKIIENLPKSSKGKRVGELPFGVCVVRVYRTDILQSIYGAIQEYGNFINEKWLG